MNSKLPVIVGFGGFNAAGRSSGHQAYRRLIIESLNMRQRQATLKGLAGMMGLNEKDETRILASTLVRKIEASHFDADHTALTKKFLLKSSPQKPASLIISRRQLPTDLPSHWHLEPLDDCGKQVRISLSGDQEVKIQTREPITVKAAGQLPTGFDPAIHYRSHHHPRGLQMAIMAASDAVRSIGIEWRDIAARLSPDEVSVYSASVMSQLDHNGFGGLFGARRDGDRVSSKQLALGFNTMPADFINAYVLGSMGSTGGIAGACATFLYNLRQGVDDIRSGRRKVSVVGASEAPILPEIIDGYAAMGALASDAELLKLDGLSDQDTPDYRRASRPFGDNCGFTLAESAQYVVLMCPQFAIELGAKIYGAVPAVYINADGYKRSISAPGAGNYITVAKSVGLARTLLGEDAIKKRSLLQAHGSSTPQNRVTESKIFDLVAKAFGIERWPVCAIKAHLGHSLASASGDQLVTSLGIFEDGIIPGIKTHSHIATDVLSDHLSFLTEDMSLEKGHTDVIFLNSKGFGGNNATATVMSPAVVKQYLEKHQTKNTLVDYQKRLDATETAAEAYCQQADKGHFRPIYEFGNNLVNEDEIKLTRDKLNIPGYQYDIPLDNREGYADF